jgi:hypothetical protein
MPILQLAIQVFDGILDRFHLLGIFIRNLHVELILEGHDQLDLIQGIGSKVVYKRGLRGDFIFADAQFFSNDLFDFDFSFAHKQLLSTSCTKIGSLKMVIRLSHDKSAIDRQSLAGDVIAQRRTEEEHGIGNMARQAERSHGDLLGKFGLNILG